MDVYCIVRAARALGDPTRIGILLLLAGRRYSCTAIGQALALTRGTASYHIRLLLEAGYVRITRRGRWHLVERVEDRCRTALGAFSGTAGAAADAGPAPAK
jgi:DNA-binding transcriptional ArsR family regulator